MGWPITIWLATLGLEPAVAESYKKLLACFKYSSFRGLGRGYLTSKKTFGSVSMIFSFISGKISPFCIFSTNLARSPSNG